MSSSHNFVVYKLSLKSIQFRLSVSKGRGLAGGQAKNVRIFLSVFVYSVCQFSQYMAAVHRENLLWSAADLFSCPVLGSFTTKWGIGIGAVCVYVSVLGLGLAMSDRMFLSNALLPLRQVSFCRDSLSPP